VERENVGKGVKRIEALRQTRVSSAWRSVDVDTVHVQTVSSHDSIAMRRSSVTPAAALARVADKRAFAAFFSGVKPRPPTRMHRRRQQEKQFT